MKKKGNANLSEFERRIMATYRGKDALNFQIM